MNLPKKMKSKKKKKRAGGEKEKKKKEKEKRNPVFKVSQNFSLEIAQGLRSQRRPPPSSARSAFSIPLYVYSWGEIELPI